MIVKLGDFGLSQKIDEANRVYKWRTDREVCNIDCFYNIF